MPLLKDSLAQRLEQSLSGSPSSAGQAAFEWAGAYVTYASAALSPGGSAPLGASANLSILLGAWTGALAAQSSSAAAALLAQGVTAFWSAMFWVGPAAQGATLAPGNFVLSSRLSQILGDTSEQSTAEKARNLADAFDAGAKQVIVSDIPFIQPAPPIVGPIS